MILARRRSRRSIACFTPLFPLNEKRTVEPSTLACLLRSVVRPKELFSDRNDSCKAAIAQIDRVLHAAFSFERKAHGRTVDFGVLVTQRGKAEGVIFFRIFIVSDAYRRSFQ